MFVLGVIVFNAQESADKLTKAFEAWLHDMSLNKLSEVKFIKLSKKERAKLLAFLTLNRPEILAFKVDKSLHKGSSFQLLVRTFLSLLKHMHSRSGKLLLIIDGLENRALRTSLRQEVKVHLPELKLSVKFQDSKSDRLLQIADFVAGFVADGGHFSGILVVDV